MHIAFLTSEFVTEPYFAGGLSQYLGKLTPQLAERGHQVDVFVIAETKDTFNYEGITVHRVPSQAWLPLRCVNSLLRLAAKPRLVTAQQACSVAKALDNALSEVSLQKKFDVIQAASWLATGFFAVKNQTAPVVVRLSSYEPLLSSEREEPVTRDKKLYWQIEFEAMRKASAVYTPSKFLSNEILKMTGLETMVVPSPYHSIKSDSEDLSASQKLADWPKYLLFFGKVCKYKGIGILADAIRPLLESDPEFRLAIAGPISVNDTATQKMIRIEKAFSKQIRYLGVLEQSKLWPVLRKAHAVALPSLMDNLPNTCIEAMRLGKIVIGPEGVSFDELIENGKSGVLFRLGDILSLRKTILDVWHMPEANRRCVGDAAEKSLALMSPDVVAGKLERLYGQVITQHKINKSFNTNSNFAGVIKR